MKVLHRDTFRLGFDDELPPPRSCWPTATQRLLLQACLGGPELAAGAFAAWHARVDVLRLDHGSNRLMALLYRNLGRAGVRAPEHELLKGNWRYHWYINKTRLRELAGVQTTLAAEGVPVIALKGASLAAFYYADLGVRPMADLDLMVPLAQARVAAESLLAQGYRSVWGPLEPLLARGPGGEFAKEGASVIDLHWSVLHDCRAPWSDEAFWAGSRTRKFEGMKLRVLRPEDQILHLCAHGMHWSQISPMRWLADVAVMVRAEGHRLDLDYLCEAAARRKLANPIRCTFAWLDHYLDFGPGNVMRRALARLQPSWGERIDYVWRTQMPKGRPSLLPAWIEYSRLRREGERGDGFVAHYGRRKKINHRMLAGADLLAMGALRLPWWLFRRGLSWVKEQWTEQLRGDAQPVMTTRV